jgi:O-antigen ligase
MANLKSEIRRMETRHEPRAFSTARIVLVLTLFVAPLPFGGVYTWAWASLTVLTLLVLMLWAIGSIQEGRLRISFSPLYAPVALFLALGLVQWAFHLTLAPVATRESLLKLATDFVLFFIVIQLFSASPAPTWRRLGFAVLAFGFLLSFLSVLQFLWNPARILWVGHDLGGPFGPYVDRDHYAGLMEMVTPVSACYVISRPKGDVPKSLLWFGVLVPLVSLLLTGSRAGIISLLAEAAILSWILIRRNPLASGRKRVAAAGLGLVAVAALFFALVPTFILTKIGTINNYVPAASAGRPVVWKNSLRIVRDHLWVGTGMGSFGTAYPSYQTETTDLVTEHAHNDYIEALTETGLLGGTLILAAVVLFISVTYGTLVNPLAQPRGWLQLGAAIACYGLAIHSLADFNLRIPANAAWFACCAGLASASERKIPFDSE